MDKTFWTDSIKSIHFCIAGMETVCSKSLDNSKYCHNYVYEDEMSKDELDNLDDEID